MLLTTLLASTLISQGAPIAPWPLPRGDRYGTALAIGAPDYYDEPFARYYGNGSLDPAVNRSVVPVLTHDDAALSTSPRGPYGVTELPIIHRGDNSRSAYDQFVPGWFHSPSMDVVNRRLYIPFDQRGGGISAWPAWSRAQLEDLTRPRYGPLIWERRLGTPAAPANVGPDGDVFFATTQSTLFRLDGATGSTKWSRTGMGPIRSMPVFARDDATLIVATGRAVRGIWASDGTLRWRRQLPTTAGAPAVAPDGTVVAGSEGGRVYGLDPGSGAIRWQAELPGPSLAPPAFFNGRAFVAAGTALHALAADTGTVTWSFDLGVPALYPPTASPDGRLYVADGNRIHALAFDGSVIWQREPRRAGDAAGWIALDDEGSLYVGGRWLWLKIGQRALPNVSKFHGLSIGRANVPDAQLYERLHEADGQTVRVTAERSNKEPRAIAKLHLTYPGFAHWPLAAIEVRIVARVRSSRQVTRRVNIQNVFTGGWDKVDSRLEGSAFTETVIRLPSVEPYSSADMWVTWFASGDVSGTEVEIDRVEVLKHSVWWHIGLPTE
jgi:outer membrane protein assembly factor BamB